MRVPVLLDRQEVNVPLFSGRSGRRMGKCARDPMTKNSTPITGY